MPGDSVFDALERLHAELDEVRELLTSPRASVRVVLTPESVVLAEARRSFTMLSLFGYRVDGVVVNRIFPSAGADEWRTGWVRAQAEVLAQVEDSFAGLPVWRSAYRPSEPVGADALGLLARDVYEDHDPTGLPTGPGPFRVTRTDSSSVVHLALPLVDRDDVRLARDGDDLVISVASYRRLLSLPPGLARLRVSGARVVGGELQIRFVEEGRGTSRIGKASRRDRA